MFRCAEDCFGGSLLWSGCACRRSFRAILSPLSIPPPFSGESSTPWTQGFPLINSRCCIFWCENPPTFAPTGCSGCLPFSPGAELCPARRVGAGAGARWRSWWRQWQGASMSFTRALFLRERRAPAMSCSIRLAPSAFSSFWQPSFAAECAGTPELIGLEAGTERPRRISTGPPVDCWDWLKARRPWRITTSLGLKDSRLKPQPPHVCRYNQNSSFFGSPSFPV
jgi:hypothetical protein